MGVCLEIFVSGLVVVLFYFILRSNYLLYYSYKLGLKVWLSGRALAEHAWTPELNPQHYEEKKEGKEGKREGGREEEKSG
jgi:hypothetical protein